MPQKWLYVHNNEIQINLSNHKNKIQEVHIWTLNHKWTKVKQKKLRITYQQKQAWVRVDDQISPTTRERETQQERSWATCELREGESKGREGRSKMKRGRWDSWRRESGGGWQVNGGMRWNTRRVAMGREKDKIKRGFRVYPLARDVAWSFSSFFFFCFHFPISQQNIFI